MSLKKKSDFKNHLSARHVSHIHLCAPEVPSTATSFSAAGPGKAEQGSSVFSKDFVGDHSVGRISPAKGNVVMETMAVQAPASFKSVQP